MVNKSAKLAVLHCTKHGLGTLVTKWNKSIKNESNMGKRENQKLVQMPLSKQNPEFLNCVRNTGLESWKLKSLTL